MKLGNTRYLRITMTQEERDWIDSERVSYQLFPTDKDNWLKLQADPNGHYQLTRLSNDAAEPWRCQFTDERFRALGDFGAEKVTVGKGPKGTLWASKPTGSRRPRRSAIEHAKAETLGFASQPAVDGFDDIRQAVKQINDVKRKYTSLEFKINAHGFIEVRMSLEIK